MFFVLINKLISYYSCRKSTIRKILILAIFEIFRLNILNDVSGSSKKINIVLSDYIYSLYRDFDCD